MLQRRCAFMTRGLPAMQLRSDKRNMLRRVAPRSYAMAALSLAAGLFAAWTARQHLEAKVQAIESSARTPMVERVVAGQDLEPGIMLTPDHLALRSFPEVLVSAYSFGPERLSEFLGRMLRAPLSAGDVVLPVHMEARRPASLAGRLASGRRAITLPVDALNSQAGLLQPGDFIDLYVSFDHQRRRVTAPLLQGVLVLATGDSLDTLDPAGYESGGADAASAYATITLDAAPEDAVKLVAARESGVLTAVLRSPGDGEASPVAARGDLASLLGVQPSSPARIRKARVIYGNHAVRSVPGLGAGMADAGMAQGLFQLPYMPALTSPAAVASLPSEQGELASHAGGQGIGTDGPQMAGADEMLEVR